MLGNPIQESAERLPPTRFLTDADVVQLTDWKSAFDALRTAYATPVSAAMVPPRSMARGDGMWLRGLTAVSPNGGHMGSKLISVNMKSRYASYLVSLFDQTTMGLSALIDGNRITGIRTAATAVVAVDAVAPRRPLRVAMIGAGFEAKGVFAALAAVRTVASALVYSPTPASREGFAATFRNEYGLRIDAVTSAEAAVQGVDVVLCAARSRDETPVLQGKWLIPGMTVVSIGSTLPEQREVDEEVIRRASRIIADMPEEVAHDTGDMLAAGRAGIEFAAKLESLNDVIARQFERNPEEIILYKSVGSALQDVVIAEMLLAQARARGVGTDLPVTILPVKK
jgi:ornithine cyclodeaminase/alanine dehydrogenase